MFQNCPKFLVKTKRLLNKFKLWYEWGFSLKERGLHVLTTSISQKIQNQQAKTGLKALSSGQDKSGRETKYAINFIGCEFIQWKAFPTFE